MVPERLFEMSRSDKEPGGNVVSFPSQSDSNRRSCASGPATTVPRPTLGQKSWLARGLEQPGGKLPLFDEEGQNYPVRTVRSCIERGWAEPWFNNPSKPDWLVCRLTEKGRTIAARHARAEIKSAAAKKMPNKPNGSPRP